MAKSLARVLVTSASVTLALAGCHSKEAPTSAVVTTEPGAYPSSPANAALAPSLVDASGPVAATETTPNDGGAAPPTWRDKKRVSSPDGAVALDYPGNVFTSFSAKGASVTLHSGISEAGSSGRGDRFYYTLTLAKVSTSKLEAMKKALDPQTIERLFPDGTESSFTPIDGYVSAERGPNGATGYRITRGVEGVGDSIRIVTTHDGLTWQQDCRFCCGMISPPPTISADDQIALCDDVLHAFEAEH